MSENNEPQDSPGDVSSQLSELDLEGGADEGQELLDRCRVLVDELEVFQNYLQKEKKETAELRQFKGSVSTEYNLLKKVLLCCIFRKSDISDSYPALQIGPYSSQDCSHLKIQQFPLLCCSLGCCERLYGGCGSGETLPLASSCESPWWRESSKASRPEPQAFQCPR